MMDHADPATALYSPVAPEPGGIVVRKARMGPFSITGLDA